MNTDQPIDLEALAATPGLMRHGERFKVQAYLARDVAALLVAEMKASGEPIGSCARRILTAALRANTHQE